MEGSAEASTSTAPVPASTTDVGAVTTASEAGRAKRSRRDRPCDLCRRQKHQCIIPVKGEPCNICKKRGRVCTFEAPPTARTRKAKPAGLQSGEAPMLAEREGTTERDRRSVSLVESTQSRPPSPSPTNTVLSLIRLCRSPPDHFLPINAPGQQSRLSPGGGRAELHFISAGAFSDLTFSVDEEHVANPHVPGDVGFRQVSNDPHFPVFFCETPSLLYGTAAPDGERLWRSCVETLPTNAPQQLVHLYLQRTQPAFPILDEQLFRTSDPAVLAASGVSYAVLSSFLAHSTSYVDGIRQFHRHLWRQVLLSLEDEYRKPTLQTVQLALIVITSRPAINHAANTIAMGRLICAAQLLALHIDCSQWRIPRSEKRVRSRLWWAIVITDKWRSLLFGRPSNASLDDCDVPLPSLGDVDTDVPLSPADTISLESFIGMCKLTVVLNDVLTSFCTIRALKKPLSPAERLRKLEVIGTDLAELEQGLPAALTSLPGEQNFQTEPTPTGVRSFQICKIGMDLTLYRLTSAAFDRPAPDQQAALFRTALSLAQKLVEFLERLTIAELQGFWWPYAPFIISNASAMLVRTALNAKQVDQTTRTTCGVLFTRLVVTLTSTHHSAKWDVASLALDRIATLLRSLNGELPELVPLLQLFGPPNHANAGAPPPALPSAAQAPPPNLPPAFSPAFPPHPLPSFRPPPPATLSPSFPSSSSALFPAPMSFPNLPPPPLSQQHPSPNAGENWWLQHEILSLPEHYENLPDVWGVYQEGEMGLEIGGVSVGGGTEGAVGDGMAGAEGDVQGVFDLLRFLQGPGVSGEGQQPSKM